VATLEIVGRASYSGPMADTKTTIRSRELGDALRLAMEQAGLNGKRTARMLGWSESRVSRMLTGRLFATPDDLSALLAVLMVTGKERERLMRINREQTKSGWLQEHSSRVPEQLKTLVDHENKAVTITEFQPIIVPGLLQTGDYAQALLERSGTVPPSEIQTRVAARLGRRSLFSKDHRPDFTFFVHEFALRLPVGSREVMSDQLHELLRLAVRRYISIRVVPAAFGAHAGTAGACALLEFAELKPVVYVEEETAGHFLELPVEIALYRKIFAALADCALDEGQSIDLIAALAVDLSGDGEGDQHQG
jgi:transcriptional regulator with XRE-family HTH domain